MSDTNLSLIALFSQHRGDNCGARRGADRGAELRFDRGGGGQRAGASQTVGLLPSRPAPLNLLLSGSHRIFHTHHHTHSALRLDILWPRSRSYHLLRVCRFHLFRNK